MLGPYNDNEVIPQSLSHMFALVPGRDLQILEDVTAVVLFQAEFWNTVWAK